MTTTKFNFKYLILFFSMVVLVFSACKKHDDEDDHSHDENELITTVAIMFVDTVANDTLSFKWQQLGGPGTAITVDTIKLLANKNYVAFTSVLDESKTPVFNVSDEIKQDANNHRFVYTSSTVNLTTKILDMDTNVPALELGLIFSAATTNPIPSIGKFNLELKHYTSSSPKTGGLANGSSDISVEFPLLIN